MKSILFKLFSNEDEERIQRAQRTIDFLRRCLNDLGVYIPEEIEFKGEDSWLRTTLELMTINCSAAKIDAEPFPQEMKDSIRHMAEAVLRREIDP